MTEPADVSTDTLTLMNIMAAINGAAAALGVAIAYYAYFYVPHPDEVHYAGKYGEVVSSAAMYISVFPAFQVGVVVMSVIGRWGANRRHFLDDLELWKHWLRPTPKELAIKVSCFGCTAMELVALIGTISRSVVLATPWMN